METLIGNLLQKQGPALRLYAATWTRSPDDCVQQALIKLATTRPLPEQMVPWLYRVVRNEAISRSRSERRRRRREREVGSQLLLFAPESDLPFDDTDLTQALQSLKAAVREVVVARVWGELTFEEIAANVGCSTSAAHRRYLKGLSQLKSSLRNTESFGSPADASGNRRDGEATSNATSASR